jgi:hypothetical protein
MEGGKNTNKPNRLLKNGKQAVGTAASGLQNKTGMFQKTHGLQNMIEGSRIGMVLSQSAVPVALIPQVVSSTPAGLTGAGEAAHCRDSPYLGRPLNCSRLQNAPEGRAPPRLGSSEQSRIV